jgi:hypothetical protein
LVLADWCGWLERLVVEEVEVLIFESCSGWNSWADLKMVEEAKESY